MEQKERNEHLLGRWPRVCRNKDCKKKFYANNDWAYQIKKGPRDKKFFCSWKCLQKYKREMEEKKK